MDRMFVRELRAGLSGSVCCPEDVGYDSARQVWNARIDRRPAAIVRAASASDVVLALRTAREHGLALAVRGTGHHVAGFGVRDDAVVVDLSALTAVRLDPVRRRVRAQAGVVWRDLDRATQAAGLAVTGARISSVGIGGSTLGGGYGWLMRRLGLTIDSLVAADVVLADGRRVRASHTEHPDLLWALRGGGGNFGIVLGFEYAVHGIGPVVTGGAVFYPLDRLGEVLRGYRALMLSAPDALGALCNVIRLPAAPFVPAELHGRPAVAVAVCHSGSPEAAERDLRALDALAPALLRRVGPAPYRRVQRLFDAAGAHGNQVHAASGQLDALSDAVCDTLVEHAGDMTSPLSIVMLAAMGGALAQVGDDATAFCHRRSEFAYSISSVWRDPADGGRHIAWTDAVAAALHPHTAGVYVNELGTDAGGVSAAYSLPALRRLGEIKRRYDPDNVFDCNHNIVPGSTREPAGTPAS
jgi:FAD/FMN-containing dehydrogenase